MANKSMANQGMANQGMADNSFRERLARLRASQCERLPTPEVSVLCRATERLRRSGILHSCLQPGETAPNFQFIDVNDRPANLYELLSAGPVVVSFLRGFWCPFCKTELEAYENVQAELAALGCHCLVVTPQKQSSAIRLSGACQVIFDRDNQIARQFGIAYRLAEDEIELLASWGVRLDELNQSDRWELPLPATYLIGTDRTVAWQFVDADSRSRCCPNDLIDEVRQCCR